MTRVEEMKLSRKLNFKVGDEKKKDGKHKKAEHIRRLRIFKRGHLREQEMEV